MNGGFPGPRGGILGGKSQNRPGGGWLSNNVQSTRRGFRSTTPNGRNFGPATLAWLALSDSERADWDTASASLLWYDRYRTPQLTTGQQLFESYNTNLLYYGQGGSFVTTPPAGPTWGAVGAFKGKLDKDETDTLATVTADFAAGTILACYGQPPGRQAIRLLRSQMRYMGNVLFPSGLSVGDVDKTIGQLYAANFGASVQELETNLWTQLYEVQEGFVRLVGDPCYTDDGLAIMEIIPTGNPTSTTESLGPGSRWLFNNGFPDVTTVFADAWGPISPGQTAITKVELPYPASQIQNVFAVVLNNPPSGQFKIGTGGPRHWTFTYNLP